MDASRPVSQCSLVTVSQRTPAVVGSSSPGHSSSDTYKSSSPPGLHDGHNQAPPIGPPYGLALSPSTCAPGILSGNVRLPPSRARALLIQNGRPPLASSCPGVMSSRRARLDLYTVDASNRRREPASLTARAVIVDPATRQLRTSMRPPSVLMTAYIFVPRKSQRSSTMLEPAPSVQAPK